MAIPQYEINRRRNRPNYGENDGNLFSDFLDIFRNKKDTEKDTRPEIQKITGLTYEELMKMQRDRENQLMNKQAAKNIGLNTQDMLRSMAYGQAALGKSIAGASNLTPLNRKYFS